MPDDPSDKTERDYALVVLELRRALELLEKCQATESIPDELHDDIACAAIHHGWWQEDNLTPAALWMSKVKNKEDLGGGLVFIRATDIPAWEPEADIATSIKARGYASWGNWRYYGAYELVFWPAKYGIDLTSCTSSAECLDWIFQVHGKPWLADYDLRDLLRALNDLMHWVQAALCPNGREKGRGRLWVNKLREKLRALGEVKGA